MSMSATGVRVLLLQALLLLMMIAATFTALVQSSSTVNLDGFDSVTADDDTSRGGRHGGSVQYAGETASLSPGLVLLHGIVPGATQGAFATIVDTISFKDGIEKTLSIPPLGSLARTSEGGGSNAHYLYMMSARLNDMKTGNADDSRSVIKTSAPMSCLMDFALRQNSKDVNAMKTYLTLKVSTIATAASSGSTMRKMSVYAISLDVPGCGEGAGDTDAMQAVAQRTIDEAGGDVKAAETRVKEALASAIESMRVTVISPEKAIVMVPTSADDQAPSSHESLYKQESEGSEPAKGDKKKEKTFMQKYWMYIVPAVVIFMQLLGDPGEANGTPAGSGGENGGGGGGGNRRRPQ